MLSNNMVAGDQADGPGHADIRRLSLPVSPSHPRPLIRLNKQRIKCKCNGFCICIFKKFITDHKSPWITLHFHFCIEGTQCYPRVNNYLQSFHTFVDKRWFNNAVAAHIRH